tara:strand:- start:223 stop:414 length:192 start_codon:yes stop_codon:yes gene_type:complete
MRPTIVTEYALRKELGQGVVNTLVVADRLTSTVARMIREGEVRLEGRLLYPVKLKKTPQKYLG